MRQFLRYIALIGLILLPVFGIAQVRLEIEQQKQILEKIDVAAQAMKTMQCDFTQTKHNKLLSKDMQSKGKMYFKQPDKLRWQYTSPYDYTFIMNGDKVSLNDKQFDAQKNKMFRQITSIILGSITGGGLKSATDFNVELYQSDKEYFAKLYPKKKEVKQVYQLIEIHFNTTLTMVSSVRMVEKTGDTTTVTLSNTKNNTAIDESLFSIR
jgi:outer membrane lipoprotein-sorting protein